MLTLPEAVTVYRLLHPQSRITSHIKLFTNGSARKQYGCALCCEEGPTFAAKWRETNASVDWRLAHDCSHDHRGTTYEHTGATWTYSETPWSWAQSIITCTEHVDCRETLDIGLACARARRQEAFVKEAL